MKLILTQYPDYIEIEVMDGSLRLHCYTYDTMKEAESFCTGFSCAKTLANGLIQSLPMGYEKRKSPMLLNLEELNKA